MLYKLREIVPETNSRKRVMGITIPEEIAIFFQECNFNIEKSGTCIILKSGCVYKPTKQEVEDYEFADYRI